jgi:endonuclease YncB( thermonuclease family)
MATVVVLAQFAEDPDERQVEAGADSSPPTMRRMEPEPASTTVLETTTTSTSLPPGIPRSGDDSTVVRVIDGDTLEVSGGTRVRLIGVDAPETGAANSSGSCFGVEATRYMTELVPPGTPVRLVYDVERYDQFGRTLAYVYKLTDGSS